MIADTRALETVGRVFCVQLTAPGAGADSLGLRWEEKLDRDMGIFMNQTRPRQSIGTSLGYL